MKQKVKTVPRAKYDSLLEKYEAAVRLIDKLVPKRDHDLTTEDLIYGELFAHKAIGRKHKEPK